MKNAVLVLNADYLPHRVIDWKSAFVMIYSKDGEAAHVVATYEETVKDSMGRTYNLPAVIVLNEYVASNNKFASYSKTNVILRDGCVCQYCGRKFQREKLTIDHVIPKSQPNKLPKGIKASSFSNCVAACNTCNAKKADRTPTEAKMRLLKQPKPITKGQKIYLDLTSRRIPNEWKPYLESLPYND